jgi:lysophospholipase L1-like esterase
MNMRRTLPVFRLLSSVLCLGAVLRAQTPAPLSMDPPANPGAINPALPTIFIASDSTAARAREPQQGWGVPFADYFDLTRVNVVNLALGGRSSRTFITQGWWDKLLTQLKAGDFVLTSSATMIPARSTRRSPCQPPAGVPAA